MQRPNEQLVFFRFVCECAVCMCVRVRAGKRVEYTTKKENFDKVKKKNNKKKKTLSLCLHQSAQIPNRVDVVVAAVC